MLSDLKIALRTLYREKFYALINIAGLSLGIACCVILGLYLRDQLTYDQHNVNHERIFRIVWMYRSTGPGVDFATTPSVLGPILKEDHPEVEQYVRFRPRSPNPGAEVLIRHEQDAFYWDTAYYADPNVFDVFTHEIVYGDPGTALLDPNSVAVSETFARRYFGDANPVGRTITTDDGATSRISLVFADLPRNAHLKYDVLFSHNRDEFQIPDNQRQQALNNLPVYTYLLMVEGFNVRDYEAIHASFVERHVEGRFNWMAFTWAQPLADIHLTSAVGSDQPTGNILYVYGFAAVAVFVLLVACINYMNLATARSARRAEEVGVRKILGSGRWSLISQFMAESLLYAGIALVLGLVLVVLALTLTPLNQLFDLPLELNLLSEPTLLAWLAGLALLVGVLSGTYPAIYLSSVAPLSALVGSNNRSKKSNARLRELLVLAQFTISVGVIACTLLMVSQMRYIASKPLGFEKENRLVVHLTGADVIERIPVIRTELLKDSRVLGVAESAQMMGRDFPANGVPVENSAGVMEQTGVNRLQVDEDFIDVMGMKIIAGRDFSQKLLTDVGTGYVVNETLVKHMGWDEPIGKRIMSGRVIGVVGDFNYRSLHEPIYHMVLHPLGELGNIAPTARPYLTRYLVINISGADIPGGLRFIEETFAKFDTEHAFEFEFLDDTLNRLYLSEQQLVQLTGIFAGVCIFIACLGLFGLAAFTTEQRRKEIGIRKVLGATAAQITTMLASRMIGLVVAGAIIASALSYYAINEWLTNFTYRTGINLLVFLIATAGAAAVAFLTVAVQSYQTARADPVDALRYE